jgi:hypothetical protein
MGKEAPEVVERVTVTIVASIVGCNWIDAAVAVHDMVEVGAWDLWSLRVIELKGIQHWCRMLPQVRFLLILFVGRQLDLSRHVIF